MFTMTARSARLAALACVFAACAEPTAPTSSLVSGTQLASAKGPKEHLDVHAIHIQITSMVFNATTVDRYTFHAMKHGSDVKGSFFLYQLRLIDGEEQAVVIASGSMECAHAESNKARVGGRVTYTTFPEGIPMGSEITWSVTDNGSSAKAEDSASQPLGNNAQLFCAAGGAYVEHPVERGKIQVKG